MGATFQYLVAHHERERSLAPPLHLRFAASRHELDGWTAFVMYDIVKLVQLDEATATASQASGLAAAIYVEDSDYAYCVGGKDGEIAFHLVLNDSAADDYREGKWALEQCEALSGSPIWRFDAARRVQNWAAETPRAVAAEDVLALLNKDWLFATDAVAEFMRLLGIPDINADWLP